MQKNSSPISTGKIITREGLKGEEENGGFLRDMQETPYVFLDTVALCDKFGAHNKFHEGKGFLNNNSEIEAKQTCESLCAGMLRAFTLFDQLFKAVKKVNEIQMCSVGQKIPRLS
jgi:hypothetical protein